MNNINPVYSSNIVNTSSVRTNDNNDVVTKPVKALSPFADLKGSEAISNYNRMMVNNSNMLDIPTVDKVRLPNDINKIKGERIYNSKGELEEILIKENTKYRITYVPNDLFNYKYIVKDKLTGENVFVQNESPESKNGSKIIYSKKMHNGILFETARDKKTGEIVMLNKYDQNDNYVEKDFRDNTVEIVNNNNDYKIIKKYDLKTNKIIDKKIEHYNEYNKKEGIEPDDIYRLDIDPAKLDGQKKFYSNGNIEENIVNKNGVITKYSFDTTGNLQVIENDNIRVYYDTDGFTTTERVLPNGHKKITAHNKNGTCIVSEEIEKNVLKECFYDKNHRLIDISTTYLKD